MAQVSQSVIVQTKALASDNLFSSRSSINGISLRTLGKTRSFAAKRRDVCVSAKLRKPKRQHQYPWSRNPDPNVKGGVLTHLSPFKPLTENRKPVILDFEKPLMNLEKKIIDVRNMARETGLDFTTQIMSLEKKYQQVLRRLYKNLTPIQRVSIARHPHRPTFLDHVFNITEKFVELHGDRAGYDDPAIVTGLGTIEGRSYMFIGHQKGRNTKENIKRNFGMPTPHGYRKALRMMYYADHHGFPIVTFIDTPGAFADLKSEALGQGEAIAHNLRTMFGLKVPIISIVIGEGGSGGALAIGCANKLLFLENAVFYVASPEACAAILYKSAKAAPLAAKKLKITARELTRLKIADGVIPEPLGGAHVDPSWTSQQIKKAVLASMDELTKMDTQELLQHRHKKFRKLGGFQEGLPVSPKKKVNMKKKEAPSDHDELEKEVEKLKDQVLSASTEVPRISLDEMVKKLEREVESEYSQAFEALQLQTRRIGIMTEIAKAKGSKDQLMHPAMLDQMRRFKEEVKQRLPSAPNYAKLSKKLDMLKELSKLKKMSEANTKAASLKEEMDKIMKQILDQPQIQEKVEMLKAEIDRSGAVTHEDLDGDLKERLFTVKKEIETQFVNALKSMNLDVEVTKARPMLEESLSNRSEELDGEIRRRIEEIVSSSDLKMEIKMLQSEAAKAGKNPSAELLNKIQALKQQISERVEKDLSASELMRKLEEEHGQEESTKMVSSLVGSDVGV